MQANLFTNTTQQYFSLGETLTQAVENAALRGVQMKLILPGVPDKWTVKELASSRYERLMKTGVEIYEYAPGFAHAKVYLAGGEIAMAGTINMDHRSLVHNFENVVWIYRCDCIESIKAVLLTPLLKASVSMKTKQTGIGFGASFAA